MDECVRCTESENGSQCDGEMQLFEGVWVCSTEMSRQMKRIVSESVWTIMSGLGTLTSKYPLIIIIIQ